MKRIKHLFFVCMIGIQLLCAGCNHNQVSPHTNHQVIALYADDIVLLMRKSGFNDKQILELGAKVRNALALYGAAQIVGNSHILVMYAVRDTQIHITTHSRGSFLYDTVTKTFRD